LLAVSSSGYLGMGIAELGCGVDGLALVPDGLIESAGALLRRDKLEGAVLVFVMGPVGKRSHPALSLLQALGSRGSPLCSLKKEQRPNPGSPNHEAQKREPIFMRLRRFQT